MPISPGPETWRLSDGLIRIATRIGSKAPPAATGLRGTPPAPSGGHGRGRKRGFGGLPLERAPPRARWDTSRDRAYVATEGPGLTTEAEAILRDPNSGIPQNQGARAHSCRHCTRPTRCWPLA